MDFQLSIIQLRQFEQFHFPTKADAHLTSKELNLTILTTKHSNNGPTICKSVMCTHYIYQSNMQLKLYFTTITDEEKISVSCHLNPINIKIECI